MKIAVVALLLCCPAIAGRAAEIALWPEGVPEPRVPAEPAENVEKSDRNGTFLG